MLLPDPSGSYLERQHDVLLCLYGVAAIMVAFFLALNLTADISP